MLHDLDQTLENILIKDGKLNKSEIDIAFDPPTGEWSARLSRPTLNLWCYDLRENLKLRNMDMRTNYMENGFSARRELQPRRIDMTYLVTAWARKPEDEHQLLWRALATLKRRTLISPDESEGMLRYQTRDMPVLVADMSNNHINLVDLWSVLDNQMRLGFILITTLELDVEMSLESPLILESTIRVGQSTDLPKHQEITSSHVEIHHKGDKELFDETGEKKVTRSHVDKEAPVENEGGEAEEDG